MSIDVERSFRISEGGFGPAFGAAMLQAIGPHLAGFGGSDLLFCDQATVAADCSVDGGEDCGVANDLELIVFDAVGQSVDRGCHWGG